jgi:hypothetical protein
MSDITPGFSFADGQLVTANNLNKVVEDATINDGVIKASHLSEDSIEGAIMGHPIMPRSDVDDSDFLLIYDTSTSQIKRLAKTDMIGTLNILFEGGVVAGVQGQQTTIDGSTGAIVMQTGDFKMESGNLETNDAHIKGNLQVDGSFSGNIAYTGQVQFGTPGTGTSTFSNTNGALTMQSGIQAKYINLTGFDESTSTQVNGTWSQKYGIKVTEDISSSRNIYCGANLFTSNFFQIGNNTIFVADSPNNEHQITFNYLDENSQLMSISSPSIAPYTHTDANYEGLKFFMSSSEADKTTSYQFRGEFMWLYPQPRQANQSPIIQVTAYDTTDTAYSWFLRSWYPIGNYKIFEILALNSSGLTNRVNIGSTAYPSDLAVFGDFGVSGTKNFRICHPVLEGKDLQHCAVEAPKGDLIYRGKHTLGADPVNLDDNANMAEGTFVKLVKDVQVFVQNNAGWDRVKGRVEGNKLYIECENADCTDIVDWLVIGERNDDNYINGSNTDDEGNFITELDCIECPSDVEEFKHSSVPPPIEVPA